MHEDDSPDLAIRFINPKTNMYAIC